MSIRSYRIIQGVWCMANAILGLPGTLTVEIACYVSYMSQHFVSTIFDGIPLSRTKKMQAMIRNVVSRTTREIFE